jgi:hypothetical protein
MSWISSNKPVFLGILILILFNEHTLVVLDEHPPLSDNAVQSIRIINFLIVIFALFQRHIKLYLLRILKATTRISTTFILPVLIAVLALDFGLGLIGFGYPSHYDQENIERFPTPSDTFRGKPSVRDHNSFGFRGTFDDTPQGYNVAIFGGSTTYNGTPPIIELVVNKLETEGISVDAFNFGSVSSNHSQHVHRLLEFSDRFRFDLVIFYGGGNETLQYASYDPRPGYPYNFFFRNELAPWKQMLLQKSSILGTVDIYTGGLISGLRSLKAEQIDAQWTNRIVNNYWRDLGLANLISHEIVRPQRCNATNFLSVLQPGNPFTNMQIDAWNALLVSQTEHSSIIAWDHLDLSHLQSTISFTDIIHVTQESRETIANHLAREVSRILLSRCN